MQDWLEEHVGPHIAKDGTGLASLLPFGRFRIYTVTGGIPSRSRSEYRLHVDGLVDRELDVSFADLRAMAPTALTRDFQCVTGWRVHDVRWRGVRLADLLDRAGVQPRARAVAFHSFDGAYTESLTLEQARRDDVIVAYELEGELISDAHGGPARLYVAPMYGYKSCKWLERIEVTRAGRARVLGGSGLRRGRMGREIQRARRRCHLRRARPTRHCHGSTASSARCTG